MPKRSTDSAPQVASGIPVHCRGCQIADITSLRPFPGNPNKHPDEQIALLARIIRARGWRHPVIVSSLSGRVVAGHGRIEAARLLGVATVPMELQPFGSEDEEREFVLSDNRLAELAERDGALLKDMLEQLDCGQVTDDGQLLAELTGYVEAERERLMTQFHIDRPDGDKAGASPWDRVGDAGDGVMFAFGTVQRRLPGELFEAFSQSVGVDNLEAWLRESIHR